MEGSFILITRLPVPPSYNNNLFNFSSFKRWFAMPLYLNRKKRVDCVMDIKHFRVDRRGRGVSFRNWGGGGGKGGGGGVG